MTWILSLWPLLAAFAAGSISSIFVVGLTGRRMGDGVDDIDQLEDELVRLNAEVARLREAAGSRSGQAPPDPNLGAQADERVGAG